MKKIWINITLVAIGFLSIKASCNKILDKTDPRKIQLVNNSSQTVIFYQSTAFDSSWPGSIENSWHLINQMKTLSPNSSIPYSTSMSWEKYIEAYMIKKIPVFVVNKDSVVKYAGSIQPWPHVMSDMLKTWTLNIDSLQYYNWTLTYP